ncbi:MAG: NADH-quinone oxidoreductase subunit C [Thermodesulfobacteriota bacterium]
MSEEDKKSGSEGQQKTASGKSEKKEKAGPTYTGYDLDYYLAPQDLLKAMRKLDKAGYFLEDVACIDIQEGFQLVYHLDRFHQPGRVGLRVIVPKENPQVPTICGIFPGAAWHERECYDFFGVQFKDHPNLTHLLLDAEFDGPPPLIKEDAKRKSLQEINPGRDDTPVAVDSEEFMQAIKNCSNSKNRS